MLRANNAARTCVRWHLDALTAGLPRPFTADNNLQANNVSQLDRLYQ
jgi:hypothetical protein